MGKKATVLFDSYATTIEKQVTTRIKIPHEQLKLQLLALNQAAFKNIDPKDITLEVRIDCNSDGEYDQSSLEVTLVHASSEIDHYQAPIIAWTSGLGRIQPIGGQQS